MAQGHRRQSAFQRGQTEREERWGRREDNARMPPGLHSSPGRANATAAQNPEKKKLTSGSKLKSGITITFPEDQTQAVGKLTNGNAGTCAEDQTALSSRHPGARSQGRRSTRGAQNNSTRGSGRTPWRRGGLLGGPGEQAGGSKKGGSLHSASSGQLSDASTSSDQLQQRMEQLRAAQQTHSWLIVTWFRHTKLEKDRADELNRQMAMQAEALMHERAEIKAEKDRLERSRNEIAARLELLEGMMAGPGEEGEPELLDDFDQAL